MDVTPTAATGTTPGNTTAGAAAAIQSKGELSSDFQTFLLMLTTQMQNQDPLNPIESSDFAVQLATFSGVEQQVRTNDLLLSLADRMGLGGLSQMAGWVGMQARVDAPVLFDGTPIALAPVFPAGASDGELVVRDETGTEVQRLVLQEGEESTLWAGVGADGTPLPQGLYSFELETSIGDQPAQTVRVEAFARVTEVRLSGGLPVVVLAGGQEVAAADVTALRAAPG